VTTSGIGTRVREYYDGKLSAHGATPAGVDWNSRESQELRFAQLARLWENDPGASVLDYGCGYGALATWLRAHGHAGPYVGFDVSANMAEAAGRETAALDGCAFTTARRTLEPADYAVASGIFNVKLETSDADWRAYVLETIDDLASVGRRGWAFNALTLYSDAERRRPDLYYADPLELFDHCTRTFSRYVALLHDYPLYEFTLLVRT
jgi:SAM-dependent methyltransferase